MTLSTLACTCILAGLALLAWALCCAAHRADEAAAALLQLPLRRPLVLTTPEREALYRARHQVERALANLLYVAGTRSDPQAREQVLEWRQDLKRILTEINAGLGPGPADSEHSLGPAPVAMVMRPGTRRLPV